MESLAPQWLGGCRLRECWFEPTFHKHAGQLCHGVQIHTEGPGYDHGTFKPWRIQALAFKAIRRLYPHYALWRDFAYEYERDRRPIDVINGGPLLREWVDDASATPRDLDTFALFDELAWSSQRQPDSAVRTTLSIFGDAVDPGRDHGQIFGQGDEIGAGARHQCAALAVQSEELCLGQRGRAQRVLQRDLREPDRAPHRGRHVEMRARQRTLLRGQPSVRQLDCPAEQVKTVERCADRRHRVGDESNSIGAFRCKRRPDRDRIDVNSVDDEPGRQPLLR